MLSRLVSKYYAYMIEVLLWIMLVGYAIGGGFLGHNLGYHLTYDKFFGYFGYVIGAMLGLGIGFFMIVLWGGSIVTMIDLAKSNREILEKLNQKAE